MKKKADARRTLFSVIEITDKDGQKSFEVDWHPTMYSILDDKSPNGEVTDQIINLAEELTDSHVETG
jgi:predicted sugar kinase